MAIVVTTAGVCRRLIPANGRKFTLQELQNAVGGAIDIVHAPGQRRFLILHEDGPLFHSPENRGATRWYHRAGGPAGERILGDAVVIRRAELGEPFSR